MSKSIFTKCILIFSDTIALICSLVLATEILNLIRPGGQSYVSFSHFGFAKLMGFSIILVFWYQEQYAKRRPVWEELRQVYVIIFVFAILHFGFTYLISHHVIKLLNIVFWLLLLIVLPSMRYFAKLLMIKLGLWVKDVYIVGVGSNAYETYLLLGANQKNNILGYKVKGLVDLANSSSICDYKLNLLNLPIYNYEDLLNISKSNLNTNSDIEIVCALSTEDLLKNMHEINILQTKYDFVSIVPDIRGLPLYGVELDHFFGSDQLFLRLQNNLGRRINRIIKRIFDIIFSIFGLIVLLPVFIIFAVIIKITTSGAVFFKHKRLGSGGKIFNCIKFQTMHANSQELLADYLTHNDDAKLEWEKSFKLKNDPRVTAVGKFLRKTSLDELPQLWNVLFGEMSLVGPRPIIEAEVCRYHEDFYYYKLVRPGVTGLWQVSGRSNTDYVDRVRFDVWYVKNWSLWYDFVILLKTIVVVLGGKGAY